MEPPEMINAGEIVLKRWEATWADELTSAVRASLAELEPFMPWAHTGYDIKAAHTFLNTTRTEWEEGKAFAYGIFTTIGELIGSCSLMTRMGPGTLEIGYWIHSSHIGRGYATKAVSTLAHVGLSMPSIDRIVIRHDAGNPASGAVAAKTGFAEISRSERKREAPGESGTEVTWELRVAHA